MDRRIEFAMKALSCSHFGELCQEYGISRKTGYKWRERFVAGGVAGMEERSRRPQGHANELSEAVVCEIIRLKNAHLGWGPRKIRALYERCHPGELPSESSFKRVLERAGLTQPRKRRPAREAGRLASGCKAQAPNEVWTVDFKGWWRNMGGKRVEPLTVRDEHSRMILELRAVENSRTETIRHCFERLFEQHGLPGAMRSDNGPPFACHNGLHGLTRLSAWWLALGIDLERGRPGCPRIMAPTNACTVTCGASFKPGRPRQMRNRPSSICGVTSSTPSGPTKPLAWPGPPKFTSRPHGPTPGLLTNSTTRAGKPGASIAPASFTSAASVWPSPAALPTGILAWGKETATGSNCGLQTCSSVISMSAPGAFTRLNPARRKAASGLWADSATLHRPKGRSTQIHPKTKHKHCNPT